MSRVPSRRQRLWTVVAIVAIAVVAIAGVVAYVKLYRSQPARVFASDEDHFLFGSIRHRTGARHSVLDLARLAAHLPGASAASGWIRGAWGREPAGRGDAGRIFKAHHRLSSRGHQLRVMPYGSMARTSRGTVDDRCGGARASDRRAGIPSFPDCLRVRRAVQCVNDPWRDREELPAVAARSPAVPVPHHPFDAAAAAGARAGRPVDARTHRMGARPGGCGQRCEVLAPETPDRRHPGDC